MRRVFFVNVRKKRGGLDWRNSVGKLRDCERHVKEDGFGIWLAIGKPVWKHGFELLLIGASAGRHSFQVRKASEHGRQCFQARLFPCPADSGQKQAEAAGPRARSEASNANEQQKESAAPRSMGQLRRLRFKGVRVRLGHPIVTRLVNVRGQHRLAIHVFHGPKGESCSGLELLLQVSERHLWQCRLGLLIGLADGRYAREFKISNSRHHVV